MYKIYFCNLYVWFALDVPFGWLELVQTLNKEAQMGQT